MDGAAGSRDALLGPAALASDTFKIYCYKIVPCAKKFGHDWSECPFAHEGEKATRRCPALYLYSSIVCPDVRQSKPCPRGDVCPYSHSIFEYWMHPARFRAQICSFGPECNRRICFFAHAQEQLRVPSEPLVGDALTSRAPYLQGRVCPKSRFALYPDQVPAAMPLGAGVGMQHGAYLGQPDLGSMAGQQAMQQMVLVPMDGGAGGLGAGPAVAGQLAALQQQQQWGGAGAGGMMYVPASPAGQPGGGGMGYYALPSAGQGVPGGGGMGGGGMGGGMMQPQQQFGGAMGHMGPGGAMYGGGGSRQPVQLMAAVGADGSVSPYPMQQQPGGGGGGGAGAMGGGAAIAYAPPMYGGAASMPMATQQQWAAAQQQQQQQQPVRGEQVQQQLQALMQAAKGAEVVPQPGAADTFLLAPQQPFAHQPQQQPRSIGGVEAPAYAVLAAAPGGAAGVVPSPQAAAGGVAAAAACGGSDAGASSAQQLDELSHQIGGWRIT